MRKDQIYFYYLNDIKPDNIEKLRQIKFESILKQLKGITFKNGEVSFYCNEVNTTENEEKIKSSYRYLRNLFDLKPYKQLPKKKVSSLLVRLFKKQGYNLFNTRKYCRDGDKITTQGFYIATLS